MSDVINRFKEEKNSTFSDLVFITITYHLSSVCLSNSLSVYLYLHHLPISIPVSVNLYTIIHVLCEFYRCYGGNLW